MQGKILLVGAIAGLLLAQLPAFAQSTGETRRGSGEATAAQGTTKGAEQGRRRAGAPKSDMADPRINSGNAGSSPGDHQTNQRNPGPYAPGGR
jgi:hypothetical protein